MELIDLQRSWDDLARRDAMWAVLTRPIGDRRAWDREAFFTSGVDEIRSLLDRVGECGATLGRARALDFGCGLGRLTQALSARFDRVDGVDIAPAMIERARALNRAGARCVFHLNAAPDLRLFPDATFDFVYSNITLQHMAPRFSCAYVAEFLRVVRPGGVAVFQLPAEHVPVERPRTRQVSALPREACRATIEAPPRLSAASGARLTLRLKIRNDGTHLWASSDRPEDQQFAVRLGNHWRSRFGFMRQSDDVRTGLWHDLAPGEWIEVGMILRAPERPGVHVLELDMVQEYVRWFAKAGSKTARIRVHVDPSLAPGEVHGLPPVIAMHSVPRADVEAAIARAGAVLLSADADDSPGSDWTSYRYFARRMDSGSLAGV